MITSKTLAEMKREARRTMETNRFRAYVSRQAEYSAREVHKQARGEPRPFSRWAWRSMAAPGHKQDGLGWKLLRYRLRRHMKQGGILVIVGPTGSGKTCLLQRLEPLRAINHFWSHMMRSVAVLPQVVPAAGLFAIDETLRHSRNDLLRIIGETATDNRGFAVVFQSSESFRSYEISGALANRKVLFLEFLNDRTP